MRPLVAQCPDGTPPPCAAARPVRVAAAAPPANSVGVLYFENLSRDTADVYLAEGLTVELTARLGSLSRLQVASRTAVRRLQTGSLPSTEDIGHALNVRYLVNGSVRRAGARLRIEVELVDAASGTRTWGQQYDRSDTDLLTVQEAIASAVATAIAGRLAPDERSTLAARPTRNAAAYDHYLRGNHIFDPLRAQTVPLAFAEYEAALRLDPGFAASRGRIGFVYASLVNWELRYRGMSVDSLIALGLAAADRALRQDSTASDAWLARGTLLAFRNPRAFEIAMEAMRRAVTADPSNVTAREWYAVLLRRLGDFATAASEYQRALELDVRDPGPPHELAFVFHSQRRYDEALRWLDSSVSRDSTFANARSRRVELRLLTGDTAGARADAQAWLRHRPLGDFASELQLPLIRIETVARDSSALQARAERVRSLAAGLADPSPRRADVAMALVLVGDREGAMAFLERIRPRGAWLWSYLVFRDFDPIRSDPRFQRIYDESRPPGAPRLP